MVQTGAAYHSELIELMAKALDETATSLPVPAHSCYERNTRIAHPLRSGPRCTRPDTTTIGRADQSRGKRPLPMLRSIKAS
jgi:hypothetical protein